MRGAGGDVRHDCFMVLAFSEEWVPRSAESLEQFTALEAELVRELGRDHPLADRVRLAAARHLASDRVVVQLHNDRYALVHLTWSGRAEGTQFPRWEELGSADDAAARLIEFDDRW